MSLLEDITIQAKISRTGSPRGEPTESFSFTVNSGGGLSSKTDDPSEETTTEEQQVTVQQFNYSFGLNVLPRASLTIVKEANKSVRYLDIETYDRKTFVGSTIEITWIRPDPQDDILLFKGLISGIRISKSVSSVLYSIECTGGPTALYNTTVATKGFYPFGAYDDPAIVGFFAAKILTGEWKTPKQLITLLANELPNFSVRDSNEFSQAAKRQIGQAQQEILADANDLVEAPIIEQFWGTVGQFDQFSIAIRNRVGDLLSQQVNTATYWQMLLFLCNEIELMVIPWINKTMILPKMLFTDPPRCNVIFPSMIINNNLLSDPFDHPDQIIMYTVQQSSESIDQSMQILRDVTALVFPEDSEVEDSFSPYQGNRYMIIDPNQYRYLMYVYHEIISRSQESNESRGYDESRESKDGDSNTLKSGLETDFKTFCRNFAQYEFKRIRSEKDVGETTIVFQPLLAPGFGCFIIDGQKGMNFRGLVTRVNHSLTPTSAVTSFSSSYLVSLDEEDEKVKIKSPLWEQLIPSGANTGDSVLPNFNVPSTASAHESFSENLVDPEKTQAMEDATEAGIFTGRLKRV